MSVAGTLKSFLDKNRVPYEVVTHQEVFTAQETAEACHIPGKDIAKVVIVQDKETMRMVMAVLPAGWRIDLKRFQKVLGSRELRLANEEEFKVLFPDCSPGAEPPFGNLYKLEVYVDRSLLEDERIYFNAGTHFETVGMNYEDYARLVNPTVAEFAVQSH
ncbi:MAG: YbaK/EbsC family protein [Nitrospirae bacterium]|nr:YbaK/EbsC family protein [Nitrospirota bacterium]